MEQATMLAQIQQVLQRGKKTDPPAYTLILGAGASSGVVPTAKEMLGLPDLAGNVHQRCIPLWLYQRENEAEAVLASRIEVVRAFWRSFLGQNRDLAPSGRGIDEDIKQGRIALESDLPHQSSVATAYQSMFAQKRTGGLNTPDEARLFLREITLSHNSATRLNATHFYLASLLSLQRRAGMNGIGGRPLYDGKRPFARTLFTTNFDPLLQISLQLFQLLYYMTDRPDLLAADALQTDHHPALHLFYAHGSVHRPFLANTEDEIRHLKQRNARDLAGYLATHGVIVLGYSGWDDCLLNALNQTTSFAYNLYWLTRSEGSLTAPVRDFLKCHPNGYWVPIEDGGKFVAALHSRLCPGAPNTELLHNPIRPLIEQLGTVSLVGVKAAQQESSSFTAPESKEIARAESTPPKDAEEIREMVVEVLKDAEQLFRNPGKITSVLGGLERHADLCYSNDDWQPALKAYDSLLKEAGLPPGIRAKALFRRGFCYARTGEDEKAIADYTEAIAVPEVGPELKAWALLKRSLIYFSKGQPDKGITDCTEIIGMKDGPIEERASALKIRGFCYGNKGEVDKEIAQYTELIGLEDAPAKEIAQGLKFRAFCYAAKGEAGKAITDWNAYISMKDIDLEERVQALYFRGLAHGAKGNADKAIADFTELLTMKDVAEELKAKALVARGAIYQREDEEDKATADYSEVIAMSGAPVEQKATALVQRGGVYLGQGETGAAIADYRGIIDMEGAPKAAISSAKEALNLLADTGNGEA